MDDETPSAMLTAWLAEALFAEGLVDRDRLGQRAASLADSDALPLSARREFHALAVLLAERRMARILPRSAAPTRRRQP